MDGDTGEGLLCCEIPAPLTFIKFSILVLDLKILQDGLSSRPHFPSLWYRRITILAS